MKKIIIGIIVLAVVVWGGVKLFGTKEEKTREPIKIGVIFPLTGNNASYSEKFTRGLFLARDEINENGGIDGKKIELIIEDGMADPAKSITAYQKLRQEHKDISVIISAFSSVILALSPLSNNDHIVLMNPVASSANLSQAGDYEFNVMPLMTLTVNKLVDYVANVENYNTVAVIYVNTDFGRSGHDIFKKKFESMGGKIVAEESYIDGDTDMRTQLSKIKQSNPQAIYLATTGKSGGLIIKQIGELGIKAKLFSTDGIEAPETILIGGQVSENLTYISPAFDVKNDDPVVKKFVESFQVKFGSLPEVYAANNYDTLKLISLAVKKVGNSGEVIKNYLYSVKDYKGVSGDLSFDENGDVIKPMIIKKIQNGQFVKYEE